MAGLARDKKTKALINNDKDELQTVLLQRQKAKQLNKMQQQIDQLFKELAEIRQYVKSNI